MRWLEDPVSVFFDLGYLLAFLVFLILGKWLLAWSSRYRLDDQLTTYDNLAVAVSSSGFFLALAAIFVGATTDQTGPQPGMDIGSSFQAFIWDLFAVAGGLALLPLSRWVTQKLILPRFRVHDELIRDQNAGAGAVEGAMYLGAGFIIAGAIHGDGVTLLSFLVFYLIGQASLILFALLYDRILPYSLHREIKEDNVAAGVGFAGGIVAISLVTMNAIGSDFIGWIPSLMDLGVDLGFGYLFLLLLRSILDRWLLRHANLQDEIVRDRNVGVGLLEFALSLAIGLVLIAMH